VFRICPAKLAQESGYVEEALDEHLSVILEKGYGRYLSNQSLLKLSSSAREHIREEREKWEFKRDNRVVNYPEADHSGNEDDQHDELTKEG
jgi:hypothetical protein